VGEIDFFIDVIRVAVRNLAIEVLIQEACAVKGIVREFDCKGKNGMVWVSVPLPPGVGTFLG